MKNLLVFFLFLLQFHSVAACSLVLKQIQYKHYAEWGSIGVCLEFTMQGVDDDMCINEQRDPLALGSFGEDTRGNPFVRHGTMCDVKAGETLTCQMVPCVDSSRTLVLVFLLSTAQRGYVAHASVPIMKLAEREAGFITHNEDDQDLEWARSIEEAYPGLQPIEFPERDCAHFASRVSYQLHTYGRSTSGINFFRVAHCDEGPLCHVPHPGVYVTFERIKYNTESPVEYCPKCVCPWSCCEKTDWKDVPTISKIVGLKNGVYSDEVHDISYGDSMIGGCIMYEEFQDKRPKFTSEDRMYPKKLRKAQYRSWLRTMCFGGCLGCLGCLPCVVCKWAEWH